MAKLNDPKTNAKLSKMAVKVYGLNFFLPIALGCGKCSVSQLCNFSLSGQSNPSLVSPLIIFTHTG